MFDIIRLCFAPGRSRLSQLEDTDEGLGVKQAISRDCISVSLFMY